MTVTELMGMVERVGGFLALNNDGVTYQLPEDAVHLVPVLRENREQIIRVLKDRMSTTVRAWMTACCVPSARCVSNPDFLHREFSRYSGIRCTRQLFIEELRLTGYGTDSTGMIVGLCFGADFVAAAQYERNTHEVTHG